MNASDFAKFFDFSIKRIENEMVDKDEFFWGTYNEDNTFTGYRVADNEAVLTTRYIDKVGDLVECFDSMLTDYIDSALEDYGCPVIYLYDYENYDYEKARNWIEESRPDLRNTDIYDVICCLANRELIFDDVTLDKTFSPEQDFLE